MRLLSRNIDEYTLAAYLAGSLTPRRRREVARLLAESDDARDLILAARELMDVHGDGAEASAPKAAHRDVHRERVRALAVKASVGILIVAVIATTLLALRLLGEVAQLRALAVPQEDTSWQVGLAMVQGGIEWEATPGAQTYRVVFVDPESGQRVEARETTELQLEFEGVPSRLGTRPFLVWVEAVDEDGLATRRTRAVPLRLTP